MSIIPGKKLKHAVLEHFDRLIKSDIKLPEIFYKDIKNIRTESINIWYPLIPRFAYAHIFYDPLSEELLYYVEEPELSKDEELLLKKTKEEIIERIYYYDIEKAKSKEDIILDYLFDIIKRTKIKMDLDSILKVFYYLWRDMIGLEKIEPIMHDLLVEDISCDGYDIPIYVHHKKFGILKTNITFSREELERFVIKLAQKSNRYISYAEPLLDATLPDGSRVNATYSSDVTTRGPTFTIRKFRREILSIIDLIKNNTLNIDMAAYLWWAIENRANIIVAGETASGKTTLLNAISMFIPPNAKIISIEDTREIQLYHENWVPSITRKGFLVGDKVFGEINMYDLLKESFRQNPDYIIVGEVRGQEAYVMFQGMASGHAALSTMHADTLHSIIRRLTTPPINLPVDLLELLDLAIFMTRARNISPSARRVREIIEIGKYENGRLNTNKIFSWSPTNDSFDYYDNSILSKELESRHGLSAELDSSIEEKIIVLRYLYNKNIRDAKKIYEYVKAYYLDKDNLLNDITNEVY